MSISVRLPASSLNIKPTELNPNRPPFLLSPLADKLSFLFDKVLKFNRARLTELSGTGFPAFNVLSTYRQVARLRFLTCTQYRRDYALVVDFIARGSILPELQILCIDFGSGRDASNLLLFTDDTADNVALHNLLQSICLKGLWKAGLQIYIRGIPFNSQTSLPVASRLVQLHFNTLLTGGEVKVCPEIRSIEYRDLLETFLGLRAFSPQLPFPIFSVLRIYPNLQQIILENWEDLSISISIAHLTTFLSSCRALTKLILQNAHLDGGLSVAAEVLKLDCLSRLHYLSVYERPNLFAVHIDLTTFFRTKASYLQFFNTNLTERQSMFKIVKHMKIGCQFNFDFICAPTRLNFCSQLTITRRTTGYHAKLLTFSSSREICVLNATFANFRSLKTRLSERDMGDFINHWQDQLLR